MPKKFLSDGQDVEDVNCGCRGCASGDQGEKNIFGNKFGQVRSLTCRPLPFDNKDHQAPAALYVGANGMASLCVQYLARIQVARERRQEAQLAQEEAEAPAAPAAPTVWAADASEEVYEDDDEEDMAEPGGGKRAATDADKEADAYVRAHKKSKK